jgi:hypothetical protein
MLPLDDSNIANPCSEQDHKRMSRKVIWDVDSSPTPCISSNRTNTTNAGRGKDCAPGMHMAPRASNPTMTLS